MSPVYVLWVGLLSMYAIITGRMEKLIDVLTQITAGKK